MKNKILHSFGFRREKYSRTNLHPETQNKGKIMTNAAQRHVDDQESDNSKQKKHQPSLFPT